MRLSRKLLFGPRARAHQTDGPSACGAAAHAHIHTGARARGGRKHVEVFERGAIYLAERSAKPTVSLSRSFARAHGTRPVVAWPGKREREQQQRRCICIWCTRMRCVYIYLCIHAPMEIIFICHCPGGTKERAKEGRS